MVGLGFSKGHPVIESFIGCSVKCSQDTKCGAFYYNEGTYSCRIFDKVRYITGIHDLAYVLSPI